MANVALLIATGALIGLLPVPVAYVYLDARSATACRAMQQACDARIEAYRYLERNHAFDGITQRDELSALSRFTGTIACTGTISDDVFQGYDPIQKHSGEPSPYRYLLTVLSAGISFHIGGAVARQDAHWSTLVDDGDRLCHSLQHRAGAIAVTVDRGRITRLEIDGGDLPLHESSSWRLRGIVYEPPIAR